ncbi:RidA family protein [Amycolatopsis sp. WGS_07]|uniref:RidA family protein n=1 Tax=Amycolatopsis sp. WGS_07 TaxID=3076764 RepID=UPI003873BFCF
MTIAPSYENPPGVGAPFSAYSHVSRAGELIFVAGQCGIVEDNSVAGPDVRTQTLRAYENVRTILESQGATLRDVVRFVSYLTSRAHVADFYAAREEYFARHYPRRQYPPNTLLIVQGLVREDLLVEIDATACRLER